MIDVSRIRWIFFDVGDTLLDESESMLDWCAQMAIVLTQRGRPTTAAEVWTARERGYAEFATNMLDRILENLSLPSSMRDVFKLVQYQHALERPFVGTSDALNRLSARFRLGVIANQSAGTDSRMCQHGWRGVFSVCISSTEEKLKKPDPAIFQLALDRAGCRADQAVMVGDRIDNDIAPAKALGMTTIRLRQGLAAVQEPRDSSHEADITLDAIYALPAALGVTD
jgi:HAD superfamily hydrolase (TIGR01549 family)